MISAAIGSRAEALAAFERARPSSGNWPRSDPRKPGSGDGLAEVLAQDRRRPERHRPSGRGHAVLRAGPGMSARHWSGTIRTSPVRDRPGQHDRIIGLEQIHAGSPVEAMQSYRRALAIFAGSTRGIPTS